MPNPRIEVVCGYCNGPVAPPTGRCPRPTCERKYRATVLLMKMTGEWNGKTSLRYIFRD